MFLLGCVPLNQIMNYIRQEKKTVSHKPILSCRLFFFFKLAVVLFKISVWISSDGVKIFTITIELSYTASLTSIILSLHFPGGWVLKNSPANTGDSVRSLAWADPLEKEMATLSSILAGEILPGRRTWWGCSPWGHKRVRCGLVTKQQQPQHTQSNCLDWCCPPSPRSLWRMSKGRDYAFIHLILNQ